MAGYSLAQEHGFLPHQYFLTFEPQPNRGRPQAFCIATARELRYASIASGPPSEP